MHVLPLPCFCTFCCFIPTCNEVLIAETFSAIANNLDVFLDARAHAHMHTCMCLKCVLDLVALVGDQLPSPTLSLPYLTALHPLHVCSPILPSALGSATCLLHQLPTHNELIQVSILLLSKFYFLVIVALLVTLLYTDAFKCSVDQPAPNMPMTAFNYTLENTASNPLSYSTVHKYSHSEHSHIKAQYHDPPCHVNEISTKLKSLAVFQGEKLNCIITIHKTCFVS